MLQRIAATFVVVLAMVATQCLAKGKSEKEKELACAPLKQACQAAGFKAGEAKKKNGLYADCIDQALAGKKPAKVRIKSADVDSCKKVSNK